MRCAHENTKCLYLGNVGRLSSFATAGSCVDAFVVYRCSCCNSVTGCEKCVVDVGDVLMGAAFMKKNEDTKSDEDKVGFGQDRVGVCGHGVKPILNDVRCHAR